MPSASSPFDDRSRPVLDSHEDPIGHVLDDDASPAASSRFRIRLAPEVREHFATDDGTIELHTQRIRSVRRDEIHLDVTLTTLAHEVDPR